MITDFNELLARAEKISSKKLVVAAAEEEEVLEAVKMAFDRGLVKPVLIGDARVIEEKCKKAGLTFSEIEIIDSPKKNISCQKAVKMVSSGEADILMKGLVDTSMIMKEVLNKEYGLRTERLMSHIAMIEAKNLNRILFVTDGGMNIKPDLEQKRQIIQNAIEVAQKLGWNDPKVAVLAAVEKVNPQMVETLEAAALAKMSERGQIFGGIVDGPLAIDNALSEEAARIKNITSPVAGKADILLVPEIVAGNILGKSSIYFASDRIAAIIGGTSRPVVVTSRANTAEIKMVSIAAAVCMAD